MKLKWFIPVFLALIYIAGCASAPPPTGHPSNMAWYQPGVSAEQTGRDLAACQYYAMVNAGGYSVQGDTVGQTMLLGVIAQSAQQSRENQLIQSRMIALGYSLVKTNSPLFNAVPIADANIIEIEKTKAEKGDAEAQFNLGNLYYTGYTNNVCGVAIDYTESINWFQKAADQNYPNIQPPLAYAYARRSYLEQRNCDLDGALADCNKAIEVKPDVTAFYVFRGTLRRYKGDLDGAMTDFNNVIALNPKDAFANAARGEVYYDLQKFADALADFRKSCELNSNVQSQDYSHINIWLSRARLGEQDAATKELQTYLDNRKIGTPDDWPLKVGSFLTGQTTEPELFKGAVNMDKQKDDEQHCEAYLIAGTKRLIEGDKTTASDYFEKCLATGCNDFDEYSDAKAELMY
jgi:lipoprotein NlpI